VDEVADGAARPERGGDAQGFGSVVVDQLLEVAGLRVVEHPAGAGRAAGAVPGQGIPAAAAVGVPPARDGFAGHTEGVGDGGLRQAHQTGAHGAEAESFQGFVGQLAGVGDGERHDACSSARAGMGERHPC